MELMLRAEYASREDKGPNRFNGYCAACCTGFAHWHPEVEPPVESLGWTWWTAMLVALAMAEKEHRRWRVRGIPIFKRGTDVVVGGRYWPEPVTPAGGSVVSGEANPHTVWSATIEAEE